MKPECCFYFVGSARKIVAPVKLAETVGDVSCGMIGSGRFRVCGGELLEYIDPVLRRAEARPQRQPAISVELSWLLGQNFSG